MLIVCVVAQSPAVGVKVQVVVARLLIAGVQVPEIPLVELVGNGDTEAPEQIAATEEKIGVTFGVTVMLSVVVVAHCPAVGVNVQVVVAVLLTAGDHEPVIAGVFVELVGKTGTVAP